MVAASVLSTFFSDEMLFSRLFFTNVWFSVTLFNSTVFELVLARIEYKSGLEVDVSAEELNRALPLIL